MKIVATIARLLLGAVFVFFGSNILFPFLPTPPMPPGPLANFSGALFTTHYIHVVGFFQLLGGLILLIGRYVPLGLTILAPIIVNILLTHILMQPAGIVPGLVVTLLWLIVFYPVRSAFYGLFQARVTS